VVISGSFGHFQASKSGVHKGQLNKPLVKGGFVATRISVSNCWQGICSCICSDCLEKYDIYTVISLYLAPRNKLLVQIQVDNKKLIPTFHSENSKFFASKLSLNADDKLFLVIFGGSYMF